MIFLWPSGETYEQKKKKVKKILYVIPMRGINVIPSILLSFLPDYCHSFGITYCYSFRIYIIPSELLSFLQKYCLFKYLQVYVRNICTVWSVNGRLSGNLRKLAVAGSQQVSGFSYSNKKKFEKNILMKKSGNLPETCRKPAGNLRDRFLEVSR